MYELQNSSNISYLIRLYKRIALLNFTKPQMRSSYTILAKDTRFLACDIELHAATQPPYFLEL